MGQPSITISVVSKYSLDQAAFEALLARLPGLKIVSFDLSDPPQVLVVDSEINTTSEPLGRSLQTALLFLVPGDEAPTLSTEAGPGVLGLFSKNESVEALSIAIRQLSRGEAYLSPVLALSLLQRKQSREKSPKVDLSMLTEREREVLALLAEGFSNKAIASRLYLSVRTVDGHLSNLYARLGVRSRTEAMRLAIEQNLIFKIR